MAGRPQGLPPGFEHAERTTARQLAGGFASLVAGWREVFVPLVVLVHSQHGTVLATAGLAVAAVHVGPALRAYGTTQRPVRRAALLAALALILLGLVPEEGPLGLLLWLVFGLTWPVLSDALTSPGRSPQPLAWLLLGMALAGPLALGPGAWLIAAGCMFWAWRAPSDLLQPLRRQDSWQPSWLAWLLSLQLRVWFWLIPFQLLSTGLSVPWVGVAMAAGWLAREVSGHWARRNAALMPLGLMAFGSLILALVTGALAWAASAWQVIGLLALHGLLAGGVQGGASLVAPGAQADLPLPQAAAALLGPLIAVPLVLLGGPAAPFWSGTALAATMALALARRAVR